jgi:ribonuclease P protein component
VLIRENDRGYARLGLAISRKYTKSAVQRNAIKRLIREAFRSYKKELGAIDMVFVARPALSGKTRRELADAVNEIYMHIK